jgi:hypothetical protein
VGTGIPEEFRRNLEESGQIAGIADFRKTGIFLPLPKGGSCEQIPLEKQESKGILRNPGQE